MTFFTPNIAHPGAGRGPEMSPASTYVSISHTSCADQYSWIPAFAGMSEVY
jgi:hypothetical protein